MDENGKRPRAGKKVKFRINILGNRKNNMTWIATISAVSFFLSIALSVASSDIMKNTNIFIALFIVLVIIVLGIIFDMIGIAVTAADETPFHAMASRRLPGARQSIKLIRHAHKVSSFCNDVIGDIAGIMSGAASALIIVRITAGKSVLFTTIVSLAITGMVASVTVGGKAIGKTIAIHNSNFLVYRVGLLINMFKLRRLFKGRRAKHGKRRGN